MPRSQPTRFGILGCGSASVPVCEAISASPLTELAAVYDVNPGMAADISQRFEVPAVISLTDLLANPSVDAIYIAVPHYLLAPLTRAALEAGKHVLTEKPLALSIDELDALISLATDRELALGVFYEMRYAPAHGPARDLVQAGAIGTIIAVQIQTLIDKPPSYWQSGYTGRSNDPWRGIKAQAGGGVVLMNTSHLLDAVTYITGLQVIGVSAEIGSLVAKVEVEDTAAATLRFDNGAIGTLLAGAHISGALNDECITLFGTHGQIRLPDPYGSNPLRVHLDRDWQNFRAGEWHTLPAEPASVYQLAVEDFVRSVQAGRCPPINGSAARQVLGVVLAMYRSAIERAVIPIQ